MADAGLSTKGESRPKYLVNNEEGSMRDNEIWVNLNERRNDNPCELLQTKRKIFKGRTKTS